MAGLCLFVFQHFSFIAQYLFQFRFHILEMFYFVRFNFKNGNSDTIIFCAKLNPYYSNVYVCEILGSNSKSATIC